MRDMIKNMKIPLSLFIFVFLSFLYGLPVQIKAQSSPNELSGAAELLEQFLLSEDGTFDSPSIQELVSNSNPLTLTYSPKNIKPGDRITVRIQDYGKPTDFLSIRWYVDGELFSSGVGIKTISFTAGAPGAVSTVYAEITKSSGSIERTAPIVVGASYIDILWEAVDVKTPPFYKGKMLPSWDTIVRAHAVPEVYSAEGQQIPSSVFVYKWKKNLSAIDLGPQSGYGKDSVYMLADFTRKQHVVGADISHSGFGFNSFNSVAIRLHDASTLLYEKHPLQGIIFEKALPSVVTQTVSSGSLRIVAYPFGLDARNSGDISHTWKLNGRTLNNNSLMNRGEISLVASDSKGVSTISVETRNKTKPLQSTSGRLRINIE
jgi:hypothetical protein